MQTGLIHMYGNSKFNYYKQIFKNTLVNETITRIGSNADLLNQLQVDKDYKSYKSGRSSRKQFRSGDLEGFAGMITNNIPFREKDFKILRGLIDSRERLLVSLNDARFTLTHDNLKKNGKMYNSLKYMYTSTYINKPGSDKFKEQITIGIDSGSLSRAVRPKQNRSNRNGRLFPYLNTTDIDLTRYQIIKYESQLDLIQEHCIIQSLLHAGISVDVCNRVKLTFTSNYEFPRCKLTEVAKIIEHQIVLYFAKDVITKNGSYYENQIYGKFDKSINLALYCDHYFILEDVDYTLFSISNYNEIKEQTDWNKISRRTGIYYKKLKCSKINSLELVYNLNINNHFVKSNILKLVDTRQKEIYLDAIENEQELFEIKESKFIKVPVVFYADTETDVTGTVHQLLYFGIINETDNQPFIFSEDFTNNFYQYITKTINKLPRLKFGQGMYCPVVYFHNVKYDFAVIKDLFNIHSICEKNSTLYSIKIGLEQKAGYISKSIELVDSYKMISIPLSKFNNTFSLGPELDKKEAIAYTYYTSETKYNTCEDIDIYTTHMNPKSLNTFMDNLNIPEFEYSEINNTFNPYVYYMYYLKYDVLVLKAGLQVLRSKMIDLTDLNINNILTISSLVDKSFKNQDCYKDVCSLKGNIRDYVSSAIYGGRVAVNQKYVLQEINDEINDYDCTSLYPSAVSRLAKEMGIPIGKAKKLTTLLFNEIRDLLYYVVTIKITSINKHQQIPFIGVKVDGILNYTNEVGDGIIMNVDKITLEDFIEFHQIEFEIIKGVYWDNGSNKTIGSIIDLLFQTRIDYKKIMKKFNSTDSEYKSADIMQNLIKLMLNSVYGKTIMKKNDSHKLVKSNGENLEDYIYNNFNTIKNITKLNLLQSVVETVGVDDSSNFAHVGCLILSYSKRIMNEVMNVANDNDIVIYYQDTDSMHLKNIDILKLESCYKLKYNTEIRGTAMAKFHSDFSLKGSKKDAEIIATTSIFLGKKCYVDILQSVNDKDEIIQDVHIKLKGITESGVNHKINYYMKEQKMNKVDAVKYMFNEMLKGTKMAFVLNPKNEKVMFDYHSYSVSTSKEQIRILDYSDEADDVY
jgi:hypothetical protein